MFTISKPSADRLDLALSGTIDAATMRDALATLADMSDGMSHGRVLYDISDFGMPTLGALAVEFQELPTVFGILEKFDKCAVLCDAEWVRSAAEVEGALIPGLEIKAFARSERSAAEDWLQAGSDASDASDDENFPV